MMKVQNMREALPEIDSIAVELVDKWVLIIIFLV